MEKLIQKKGYDLHLLHTKKFKTINISFKFTANLNRDTVTKRALLPYVLQQGTENYPTATKLRQKLDELYGAILHIDSSKKGEKSITTIRMELANERYLSNKTSLLDDSLALLQEVIYSPKTKDGGFDPKIFDREKKTLKSKMDALTEDKMSLANTRLIEEMCADEPYRLRVHGFEEDLADITPADLYKYYQYMLQNDHLDVFVVGDIENLPMDSKIDRIVSREKQPNLEKTIPYSKNSQADTLIETDKIQQAKLHFGYRTNILYDDTDYAALHVFNGLFGGFPSSKLFMNVREKHSLAYYAASRIESHKGLLFVFSGIAPEQYEKAKEIILEQMDQMQQGEFTDQQVDETKEMTINQLKETLDNPQGMIELHYQRVLAKSSLLPDQLIANVKKVTKEDVLKVAEKIKLDMIYLLTSEGV
ncbi:Predicted Zn-dependent peptidase [Gracilibacillus ureilyticus]|uniref:Predicted Zn-dependent peptidase n=1 Tax=Gracilibacillus ureilyticus TaxID=531814 RepID=A0A1H9LA61_9BACI|nr:Predicted Zn-dependent peptidase [Gracilibacillus ureilyticus]